MMGLIDAQPQQTQQPADAGFSSPEQQPAQPDKQKMFKIQKIVVAAQKLMYNPKTKFIQSLEEGDPAQVAAKAAVSVMLILIQESQLKIDPSLIIPAGVIVVGDILDFLEQAGGVKHDENQVEQAVELFVKQIMAAVQPEQAEQSEQGEPQGLPEEQEVAA